LTDGAACSPDRIIEANVADRTGELVAGGGYVRWGGGKMGTITSKRWLVVSVLLSPLVVSGCVWKSDYEALQSQNQALQSENQQLQQQLAASKEHVGRLQHAMAYTVNSDLLFKSGSWEMTDRGKQIIAQLSQKLAPTQQNKLIVSGYTDDRPIGARLKRSGVASNQELSQKRADAVMQYLISQGVKPENVSAQGFGERDPIASNDTAQGRAKNRRVVLSVGGETASEGASVAH
jgi:chemotaxis protein MotB